jgi:hypothetical protein
LHEVDNIARLTLPIKAVTKRIDDHVRGVAPNMLALPGCTVGSTVTTNAAGRMARFWPIVRTSSHMPSNRLRAKQQGQW